MPDAPLRVLLVEDDPLVRQLLAMVWSDYALQLRTCTQVRQALDALREAPADLIVTDLMLPGESGLDLLARLAAEPALRGTARVAVFSAGLNDAVAARLRDHGVWRVLPKPLPIEALQDCVEAAGARLLEAPADLTAPRPAGAPADPSPSPPALPPTPARPPAAVATHFGGNLALYQAFREAALRQFLVDMAEGDAAASRGDAPALRRLAHTLKSVLRSLGHEAFAELAAALEDSARQSAWGAARPQWAALRRALDELASGD
ncbi:response regulator [Ideonella sp. DXS22W]|uniref:Response regulator n=1 Tax=Pseudaquabacterium inlustre TaxID=2984192 RepID=A0ABU9CF17_9BURK